jgi:hypothetical protein
MLNGGSKDFFPPNKNETEIDRVFFFGAASSSDHIIVKLIFLESPHAARNVDHQENDFR